ncbi:MAG: GAF domain-containing sensor histidine kinase [Oleispira sp.]
MSNDNLQKKNDISYWKLVSRLESGRAEVLRRVAHGDELSSILNLLCEKAEDYNPEMMCSVLRLNEEFSTLHPIASGSLPADYSAALDGVIIGQGVGSCGTAAFQKQRVVVEDINTHPYWAQYKDLALGAGLQACWSEPIIGTEEKVFGTFAMYYAQPRTPTKDDICFIETNANLAAIVFENSLAQQQLIDANKLLSQTIDTRNEQLMKTNTELSKVLVQQSIDNIQSLQKEKADTTKKILAGFAHEINTPIGVATTATSYTLESIKQFINSIQNNQLSKQGALTILAEMADSAELTQSSLMKTAALISQFRQIDICLADDTKYNFNVDDFFRDFKDSCLSKLGNHVLEYEIEGGLNCHSKSALWQVISQLVDNSLEHGFINMTQGKIGIHVTANNNKLIINYQDDGCGIKAEEKQSVFEPFFSTQRESGKIGLGLNVIYNTITNSYGGDINLVDSPVGVRYEISIPFDMT